VAAGPHPGIVILQGSSTHLRHDYRCDADRFARMGLVTPTFDKRGKGESSGNSGAASYDVLADDAAAVEILRRLPLIAGGAWDRPRAAPGYLELVTRGIQDHVR